MTLQDKVVVITGASRGIGHALALGFAQEGAMVVAVARTLRPGTGMAAGSLDHPRMSHAGNPYVRRMIWMLAIQAVKVVPAYRDYFHRRTAAGKRRCTP